MAALFCWLILFCSTIWMNQCRAEEGVLGCGFTDHEAICRPVLYGKQDLELKVQLNPCSKPVDITVRIKNGTLEWKHTFSNEDETQKVQGLKSYVALHMLKRPRPKDHVFIRASFLLDKDERITVLRETVAVGDKAHCKEKKIEKINPLPIIFFFLLCIVICSAVGLFVYWRRQRLLDRKPFLISNGEPTPYQEEAITSGPISSKSQTTTVIHNSSYRDGAFGEEADLPTIEENTELGATFVAKARHFKPESKAKLLKNKLKAKGKLSSKKKGAASPKRSIKWSGKSMSDNDIAEIKQRMLFDTKKGDVIDDRLSNESTPFRKV